MSKDRTLRLRPDVGIGPLTADLAANMLRWMGDAEVARNLGLRAEPTLEYTAQWIARAVVDPSFRPYAIHAAGAHAGNVIFDRVDAYLGTARLSVYVGEARGGGVGTSGIFLALRDAFATLGWHKVWLTVHQENYPAINTYHRLGFQTEGLLRDEFILDGRRISAFYMGLLRSDFERLVERVAKDGTER